MVAGGRQEIGGAGDAAWPHSQEAGCLRPLLGCRECPGWYQSSDALELEAHSRPPSMKDGLQDQGLQGRC